MALSEEHKRRIREGMAQAKLKKEGDKLKQAETIQEAEIVTKVAIPKSKKHVPDALGILLGSISEQVSQEIESKIDSEFTELRKVAQQNAKLDVTTKDIENTVTGLRHNQLEELIRITALRLPILMVGMAGTGKTFSSEQAATALGLPFYTMSVGAQTSKSDIIGYMNANGGYVKTMFREAYENGGVFLMDEIDAGNANVLIQINAALSNGVTAFPDVMVKKHKDFVFIASANTFGTGMNRQYVGRNQLDAATLDRFTVVEWNIDNILEEKLSVGDYAQNWFSAVKAARHFVQKHSIRALITPRATEKGSLLLHNGFHIDKVIPAVLLGSVPDDKKGEITKIAKDAFLGKA